MGDGGMTGSQNEIVNILDLVSVPKDDQEVT